MKKISHLLACCLMTLGLYAKNTVSLDSICSVNVVMDSSVVNGAVIAVALPDGTAPFSYLWSTGETTSSVEITQWGINYCVTMTDATGCTATGCLFNQNACEVTVGPYPTGGLFASGTGTSPATYLWSTGETWPFITPTASGTYCVTMTDGTGCTATDCIDWLEVADSCGVYIAYDTLNGGGYYTAIANGVAPFQYTWQPSGNTQSIPLNPAYFGDYCVTVTDATGCSAVDCIWGQNACNVWITQEDSSGIDILIALGNYPIASYAWSTGETTQYIAPTASGSYCVTITGNGCVVSGCYYYQVADNFEIEGYVFPEDSLLFPVPTEGIAELFALDAANNTWVLDATVDLTSDPSGWAAFYNFGAKPAGQYLVKATYDPAHPSAPDFFPTYHYSKLTWNEADVITLPSLLQQHGIMMQSTNNLNGGGSGNINGTVTEGEGFTANDEGERGGTPLPNAIVLLFDANEQPITYTVSDAEGKYSFQDLPFGTYMVMLEVVGHEHVERWITLDALHPVSEGNDFEVTESGIVLGLDELAPGSSLAVSPNPTSGSINLWLNSTTNFEATIRLTRLDGTTVMTVNQAVASGQQAVKLDLSNVPTGLYLLQATSGKGVETVKIVKR